MDFMFDLETFDTRHISFRDDYWFQYNGVLTNENVLEYFSISPFYERQCNNEIVKMSSRVLTEPIEVTLRKMKGIEYSVILSIPPNLFLIQKRNRISVNEIVNLETYYILKGNIYQTPDLESVVTSRLMNNLYHLHTALNQNYQNVEWHPSTGYTWKFPTPHPLSLSSPSPSPSPSSSSSPSPSPSSSHKINESINYLSNERFNEIFNISHARYFHQEEIAKQQSIQLEKKESSLLSLTTLPRVDSLSAFPNFSRVDSLSEKFEGKLSISEKNNIPTTTTTTTMITTNLTNKKKIKNPPAMVMTQPPSIIREDSLVAKFSEKLNIANEKGKTVVKSKGEGKREKKSRKHHKDHEDKDEEGVRKKKKKKLDEKVKLRKYLSTMEKYNILPRHTSSTTPLSSFQESPASTSSSFQASPPSTPFQISTTSPLPPEVTISTPLSLDVTTTSSTSSETIKPILSTPSSFVIEGPPSLKVSEVLPSDVITDRKQLQQFPTTNNTTLSSSSSSSHPYSHLFSSFSIISLNKNNNQDKNNNTSDQNYSETLDSSHNNSENHINWKQRRQQQQ
ncbi:hypothetical protein Glove_344g54 [Diversispora epigaea]|uniref:Mediator of RNA polymerase II transcription subunit 6 n=1 Tax=Diversispora epigaea TaxID=1348612 RepID=A0A397HLF9_9GLOM|nr:hypothetical protein Glove_344g54 [Diversispora epigaea]